MRRSEPLSDALLGSLAMMVPVSMWGLVPTATRYLIDNMTPGQILLARFGFGALFAALILLVLRPAMPARSLLPKTIVLGVIGLIGFNAPLVIGITTVEAGVAALLLGIQPVMIAVLAALKLGERIPSRMAAGLIVALIGSSMIAVTGGGNTVAISARYLIGCGFIILAALIYAIYSIAIKPYLGTAMPPASLSLLGSIFSLPLVIPFGIGGFAAALSDLSSAGWLAILLISMGATILAGIFFTVGLMYLPASRAGLFLYLVPVVGVVASTILLDEQIGAYTIVGGILIIGGVLLATFSPSRQPEVPEAETVAS